MHNKFKRTVPGLLTVLILITCFSACDMGLPWDIEIWGSWTAGDSVMTFTNSTFSVDHPDAWNWDYSGEIVKFDNSSYNIASDNPVSGDYGYMVWKILSHEGDPAQEGTYTVVRWNALSESEDGLTTLEYAEAYPAGWATAEEAEAEAASGTGHFSMFSSLTKTAE